MQSHHYRTCQDCGAALEQTTVYRRHAYCADCGGVSSP